MTSIAEIRESGRGFLATIDEHPDLARSLFRRSWYWIHDPETGAFYPNKFVAFAEMDGSRYRRAIAGLEPGARFNGAVAADHLQRLVGGLVPDPELARRLHEWAEERMPGVLAGIDTSSWGFATLAPSGSMDPFGWDEWDEAWAFYRANWEDRDAAMRSVVAARPGHSRLDHVVTKVHLVARGSGRVTDLARCLHEGAGDADRSLAVLREAAVRDDHLDPDALEAVVDAHRRIFALCSSVLPDGPTLRGWVSRYLAAHVEGVPEYSPRGAAVLAAWYNLREGRSRHVAMREADEEYVRFCNRFMTFWNDAVDAGAVPGVRRLGWYLTWCEDDVFSR